MVARLEQLDNVAAAQVALELLVPAAEYSGALDVMEDLQALLASDELLGLQAFRCIADADCVSSETSVLMHTASRHIECRRGFRFAEDAHHLLA